jgi:hypothetical protein
VFLRFSESNVAGGQLVSLTVVSWKLIRKPVFIVLLLSPSVSNGCKLKPFDLPSNSWKIENWKSFPTVYSSMLSAHLRSAKIHPSCSFVQAIDKVFSTFFPCQTNRWTIISTATFEGS